MHIASPMSPMHIYIYLFYLFIYLHTNTLMHSNVVTCIHHGQWPVNKDYTETYTVDHEIRSVFMWSVGQHFGPPKTAGMCACNAQQTSTLLMTILNRAGGSFQLEVKWSNQVRLVVEPLSALCSVWEIVELESSCESLQASGIDCPFMSATMLSLPLVDDRRCVHVPFGRSSMHRFSEVTASSWKRARVGAQIKYHPKIDSNEDSNDELC